MPFTWRELWSCDHSPDSSMYDADSTGVVVDNGGWPTNSLVVRGPNSKKPLDFDGPFWCWNGTFVYSFCDADLVGLTRYRGDEIERLAVFSAGPSCQLQGVALKDGTLFVRALSNYALVRNDGDGRMEIFKTGPWDPDRRIITPWWGGVLFFNVHGDDDGYRNHWHWDATTGEAKLLPECDPDYWGVAIYLSDPKRCCMVTYDEAEDEAEDDAKVIEWDAEGRRQVFPIEKKEFNFTEEPEQVGTCLGRAVVLFNTSNDRHNAGFHAFVYVGNGRFEKDGVESEEHESALWAAYGDRVYRMGKGSVRCYEVREEPKSLLDLCVRRAVSENDSSSYKILPEELRERIKENKPGSSYSPSFYFCVAHLETEAVFGGHDRRRNLCRRTFDLDGIFREKTIERRREFSFPPQKKYTEALSPLFVNERFPLRSESRCLSYAASCGFATNLPARACAARIRAESLSTTAGTPIIASSAVPARRYTRNSTLRAAPGTELLCLFSAN